MYFSALVPKERLGNFSISLDKLPIGQTRHEEYRYGAHLYYLAGSRDSMERLVATGISCTERTPSDSELYMIYLSEAWNDLLTKKN